LRFSPRERSRIQSHFTRKVCLFTTLPRACMLCVLCCSCRLFCVVDAPKASHTQGQARRDPPHDNHDNDVPLLPSLWSYEQQQHIVSDVFDVVDAGRRMVNSNESFCIGLVPELGPGNCVGGPQAQCHWQPHGGLRRCVCGGVGRALPRLRVQQSIECSQPPIAQVHAKTPSRGLQ